MKGKEKFIKTNVKGIRGTCLYFRQTDTSLTGTIFYRISWNVSNYH